MVSGALDGTVRMWDIDRRDELMVLESSDGKHLLEAVAFSPDGARLTTAGFKRLEFWDGAVLPSEIVPKTAQRCLLRGSWCLP
jgi:hypothetical protein